MVVAFIDWVEHHNIANSEHGNPPIYDPKAFPWVSEFEGEWDKIRAELAVVLQRREELPNFQDISVDVKSIQRDNNWKTFMFLGYGKTSEENMRRCPHNNAHPEKNPRAPMSAE